MSQHSLEPVRSLNITLRKTENDRIERENHAFAKRLFNNTGSIQKASMDADYAEHVAHKIRIRRVKPQVQGKYDSLQPLSTSRSSRNHFTQSRPARQEQSIDQPIEEVHEDLPEQQSTEVVPQRRSRTETPEQQRPET